MFYELFSKILFALEPETSHQITTKALKVMNFFPVQEFEKFFLCYTSKRLKLNVWNIEFPNILGLAGGFDKTGELYPVFSNFGFGFIECGTFTPQPQEGNPKPRLFRYEEHFAIVNRMGFNNPGIEKAKEVFLLQKKTIPRGINLGKNKITPNHKAKEDYIEGFQLLYPFADYFVINVSSPNTPDLRKLQSSKEILELINILQKKQKDLNISIPILIKLDPDLEEKEFYLILESFATSGIDGFILTNTTLQREEMYKNFEMGGLSGLPLKNRSTMLIKKAYRFLEGKIPIIGVGGIMNPNDALEKIMAGSSLIQIYTGFVFGGPLFPKKILQYIDNFLEKENCKLQDIIGIDAKI